jgi:CCR4-NOT transcription complex subunit 7/8
MFVAQLHIFGTELNSLLLDNPLDFPRTLQQYMMTAVEGMYGGLSALADTLQIDRIGPMHQAGSDSLLTAQTFFSLIKKHFQGQCDDSK